MDFHSFSRELVLARGFTHGGYMEGQLGGGKQPLGGRVTTNKKKQILIVIGCYKEKRMMLLRAKRLYRDAITARTVKVSKLIVNHLPSCW